MEVSSPFAAAPSSGYLGSKSPAGSLSVGFALGCGSSHVSFSYGVPAILFPAAPNSSLERSGAFAILIPVSLLERLFFKL